MFNRLKSIFRSRTPPKQLVRARFDAAQTTRDNWRHWSAADHLSADMEAAPEVRRTLRMRSRYEVANNSYARGLVLMLANDTIGTGPRLQMLSADETFNDAVETAFMRWSDAVRLAPKLRTMRMARCQDGEAFAVLATNPKIRHGVKLDLQLDEIIDFFPEAKRKVFRKILDASRRFEARSKQALTELLEDPAFDEKIDQALDQLTISSSVSPESPESIPTP